MSRGRTSRHHPASPARRRRAARAARETIACRHVPTGPDSPADGTIAEPRRSTVLLLGGRSGLAGELHDCMGFCELAALAVSYTAAAARRRSIADGRAVAGVVRAPNADGGEGTAG